MFVFLLSSDDETSEEEMAASSPSKRESSISDRPYRPSTNDDLEPMVS